jgi:hypothetical protein
MSLNKEESYKKINKILWQDWDPLNINDYGGPNDEYDGYAPEIFKLVSERAHFDTIASELNKIAMDKMGRNGNIEHCKEVAKKILLEIN